MLSPCRRLSVYTSQVNDLAVLAMSRTAKSSRSAVRMGKKEAKAKGGKDKQPTADKQSKQRKPVKLAAIHDPLERELAAVGLRVKKITADGNCFFRACCDQLEGNESGHSSLRTLVVAYMRDNEADFALFVEDDQSFEAYMSRMKKEGVWAGHMELQAASLLLQRNLYIYQAGQPRWSIQNFPPDTPALHLSYHDGEHYNSIRLVDDYGAGPPEPVVVTAAAVVAAAELKEHATWDAKTEQQVAANTGCDNPGLIRKALQQFHGDVDAAIEHIINVLANEGDTAAADAAGAQEAAAADGSSGSAGAGSITAADQAAAEATSSSVSARDGDGSHHSSGETARGVEGGHAICSSNGSPQQQQQHSATGAAQAAGGLDAATSWPGCAPMQTCAAATAAAAAEATPSSQPAAASADDTRQPPPPPPAAATAPAPEPAADAAGRTKGQKAAAAKTSIDTKKPSKNKKCPCGSGFKYKNCCGIAAAAIERRKAAAGAVAAADGAAAVQLATLAI